MKTEINDAIHKWCATYPAAHQMRIAHVAFKFRCRISSTICFLVAAYRLLAKAPAGDFPFSVAELAVAAATYLEQILPGCLKILLCSVRDAGFFAT